MRHTKCSVQISFSRRFHRKVSRFEFWGALTAEALVTLRETINDGVCEYMISDSPHCVHYKFTITAGIQLNAVSTMCIRCVTCSRHSTVSVKCTTSCSTLNAVSLFVVDIKWLGNNNRGICATFFRFSSTLTAPHQPKYKGNSFFRNMLLVPHRKLDLPRNKKKKKQKWETRKKPRHGKIDVRSDIIEFF